MATCGINLNLNNLRTGLTNQLNTYLNLNLGTPAGLSALSGSLTGALGTLKSQITDLIPIPSLPGINLRDEMQALSQLALGSTAAAGKILSIATDFLGISNLRGFANLNLTDLSKSIFSISGTFDPCKIMDGISIPNVVKSPDGLLQKLPSVQPLLASVTPAVANQKIQTITDSFTEAIKNNKELLDTDSITQQLAKLQTNISPAPVQIPKAETIEQKFADIYKANAEGIRQTTIKRIDEFRKENPDFDNPSSSNYRMYKGVTKITETTNAFNGEDDWVVASEETVVENTSDPNDTTAMDILTRDAW